MSQIPSSLELLWGSHGREMQKPLYDTTGLPDMGLWQFLRGEFLIRRKGDRNKWIKLFPGDVYITSSEQPAEILLPGFDEGKRVNVRGCGVRAVIHHQIDLCKIIDLPLVLNSPAGDNLISLVLNLLDSSDLPHNSIARSIRMQACENNVLQELINIGRINNFGRRIEQAETRLIEALQFMQKHQNRLITNAETARHIHLSQSRFKTLFKDVFGVSPMRFHLNMRLDHAARQLLHTDQSLGEIATETGFSSAFHLSRQFKKYYKLSPREFRLRHASDGRFQSAGSK